MLATQMRRMCNNYQKIRIAGSSYRPQKILPYVRRHEQQRNKLISRTLLFAKGTERFWEQYRVNKCDVTKIQICESMVMVGILRENRMKKKPPCRKTASVNANWWGYISNRYPLMLHTFPYKITWIVTFKIQAYFKRIQIESWNNGAYISTGSPSVI